MSPEWAALSWALRQDPALRESEQAAEALTSLSGQAGGVAATVTGSLQGSECGPLAVPGPSLAGTRASLPQVPWPACPPSWAQWAAQPHLGTRATAQAPG